MTAPNKWRFNENDELGATGYVVNKRLGRGAVAEAYLVSRFGQEYVLKVSVNDGDKSLRNEASIMKELNEVNSVPRLYENQGGIDGFFYVVTEYVTPEYHNLTELHTKELANEQLFYLIQDILKFFVDVHTRGYEYCDVKPDHFYWNPNNKERPLLVIDYNLSQKRQKPSHSSQRLDWVRSDLRRLGQVLFHSLLMGQEVVPDLPGGSHPIPFEGDSPYHKFLATSFQHDRSGNQKLDWYLRRLHGGKYGSGEEALDKFRKLISVEYNIEQITLKDHQYVAEQASNWIKMPPTWDEVENCWGRLGEPWLASVDELSAPNELAVWVYLWGLAIAYGEKSIGAKMQDVLVEAKVEITKKGIRANDEALWNLFQEWYKALNDPAKRMNRAWIQAIESFENGYEAALHALVAYYENFGQSDKDLSAWDAYIQQCRLSLDIWTFTKIKNHSYATLDKQCFSHLAPKAEDILLVKIASLYKEHTALREEILEGMLSLDSTLDGNSDKLLRLLGIQTEISVCVTTLLSPKKVISVWPVEEKIRFEIEKFVNAVKDNSAANDWHKKVTEAVNAFIDFMDIRSDAFIKRINLRISNLSANRLVADSSNTIDSLKVKISSLSAKLIDLEKEKKSLEEKYQLASKNLGESIEILSDFVQVGNSDSGDTLWNKIALKIKSLLKRKNKIYHPPTIKK